MKTDVYLFDLKRPWREPYSAPCTLVIRKWSWAIDPRGKRHLVGASAFFTEASAARARIGALQKIENKWNYYHRPETFHRVKNLLDKLHPTRFMH